jgi:hypothetical protein
MAENDILAEIYRTREAIARENDCDVVKLFPHFREVSAKLETQGWLVAAPEPVAPSCAVREEPPAG